MDKLNNLYEFAFEQGINIINGKYSNTKKAVCMGRGQHKNVILDKQSIISKAEEVDVLSEEIGHFETGALYTLQATHNTPVARSNRMKCEGMAKAWAYDRYCAPCEIETAFEQEGSYGDNAVAEYCSVTVDFLHKAIEYHRSHGVVFSFDNDCA